MASISIWPMKKVLTKEYIAGIAQAIRIKVMNPEG